MSIQQALRFIAEVRSDPNLVRDVQDLGPGATLDRLVALGKARGFSFTAEELREAHKHDWTLRRARYSEAKTPDPSE
jgi:predicted ribosomally synthesized peptide with nif11-like leader